MVPDWLQWSDVVLSLIAFGLAVVTLPTAFQMWWGRPAIEIDFAEQSVDIGVGLNCNITNCFIENEFLTLLGVRRTAAYDLGVKATIRESGTGKFIWSGLVKIYTEKNDSSFRIDLHPGIFAFATIIFQERGKTTVCLSPMDEDEDVKIEPGEYECEINVVWGQEGIIARRLFLVSDDIDLIAWRNE